MIKTKEEIIRRVGNYFFEGALDDVIKSIQSLKKEMSGPGYRHYSNLHFDERRREYDDGYEIVLVGTRNETLAEQIEREKGDAAAKEWRRKQYESLKKEFENAT